VEQSSGDDVVDVRQRVWRVEVDDEVRGVGHVQPRAPARPDGRHVDAARSLAGQQVPEHDAAVLRHRHQLVGCRAEHHVTDYLNRTTTTVIVRVFKGKGTYT